MGKLPIKDFLSIADLPDGAMQEILSLADDLKAKLRARQPHAYLSGKVLGMLFEKPSTRTRISFEVGIVDLGGHAVYLETRNMQLDRGETIEDTARVMSRYLDGLVMRTSSHDRLLAVARNATIPVINGLSDFLHPCQAVADIFTMQEYKGKIKGITAAYLGDGNNVAHSLMFACSRMGVNIRIVCPPEYKPHRSVVRLSEEFASHNDCKVTIEHDPVKGAEGADVLYTDVWVSMGQEAEREQRLKLLAPYQLNEALAAKASPEALIMHCLPAHRGEEITSEVLDGPQSVVLEQAENRMHVQKAILYLLMAE